MVANDHLLRDLAPIPARAWKEIDDEARERLTPLLAARRLVDWVGEGGWRRDAMEVGRVDDLAVTPSGAPQDGVCVRQRRVLPLAEVRVPFTVRRREIEDLQRGASDAELDDLARAARQAAEIENRAVFHGWEQAGISGMSTATSYPTAKLGVEVERYPSVVAGAVEVLRANGVDGPTRWPSLPPSTPGSWRPPSTVATCSPTTSRRCSAAGSCGRQGSTGRWC